MDPTRKSPRHREPQQQQQQHRSTRKDKEDGRSPGDKSGSDNTSKSKHIRECACGRGLACVGMTQAFRLLGDPRCYYVELPRYRKNPPAYKYVFRNNLRASYIRHLKSQNPSLDVEALENVQERRYVALHHFHPAVVKAFYENPLTSGAAHKHRVPISITEHELQELNLEIRHEDRILSVTGAPTGGYYFCPGYPQEKAHEDLKQLIKKARAKKEKMESRRSGAGTPTHRKVVPENIEVGKQKKRTAQSPVGRSRVTKPVTDTKQTDLKLSRPRPQEVVELHDFHEKKSVIKDSTRPSPVISPSSPRQLMTRTSTTPSSPVEEMSKPHKDHVTHDKERLDENHMQHVESEWMVQPSEMSYLNEHRYYDENGNIVFDDEQQISHSNDNADFESPNVQRESNRRVSEHPWETPKYRRRAAADEPATRTITAPAQFIDPHVTSLAMGQDADKEQDLNQSHDTNPEPEDAGRRGSLRQDDDASDVAAAAAAAQKSAAAISAAALMAMKSMDEVDETKLVSNASSRQVDPPGRTQVVTQNPMPTPPRVQQIVAESKSFESQVSEDGSNTGAIKLHHSYPGVDPTLRIQVHNDLIAWESKRRSEMSNLLNWHGEKWNALRSLMKEGLEEIKFAERFILGFSKAGSLFADLTQAVYEDKLLDDAGKTVSNSFLQNRLHKKRNAQEYSIETQDSFTDSGQSPLLSSILEAHIQMVNLFRETSQHIDEEIIPEFSQLYQEMQSQGREFEALGDSIIAELKRSEIELKNIWDVFDAMVTGDLMEYTVHGSMHGGSQHGGSIHSSLAPGTGSVHGLLNPREGEGLIVSSVNSPIVKSTFKQLGSLEDGWLVEMYYRSAVAYQQAVYGVAANEFGNLGKRITTLEEHRFRKLQELMLAFVPRQRRLLIKLPENFKNVLDDLVGLRIDEESLQAIIDNSIRDRSRDHLKRGASHRSAIMNRSKISKTDDGELERIEMAFGNPFESSWVLTSKVVELQTGGIMSMVNTSWKAALVVVTSEGNMHVFSLPDGSSTMDQSPQQAFCALCPTTEFEPTNDWPRKEDITKNLIPSLTISLKYSTFVIPKAQNCHLQVSEDKPLSSDASGGGRNGFMKVMKAAADSQRIKRCTFRLATPSEMHDWHNWLEQTKTSMTVHSTSDTKKTSLFGF